MITLADVWFVSEEHKNNFLMLANKYNAHNNPEYATACYAFGHPEIYTKVNWDKFQDSPVGWFFDDSIEIIGEKGPIYPESEIVGTLANSCASLARAAVELFTGRQHNFDLMHLIGIADDDLYKVFIQMLEIRRNRAVITFE